MARAYNEPFTDVELRSRFSRRCRSDVDDFRQPRAMQAWLEPVHHRKQHSIPRFLLVSKILTRRQALATTLDHCRNITRTTTAHSPHLTIQPFTKATSLSQLWSLQPIETDSVIALFPLTQSYGPALRFTPSFFILLPIDTLIECRILVALLFRYISLAWPAVCDVSSFSSTHPKVTHSVVSISERSSLKRPPTTTLHAYELYDTSVEPPTHPSPPTNVHPP